MGAPIFLVTGGSRGIGEAIAVAAAREGYRVLLTYVQNEARAAAVVDRIKSAGGQATAMHADTGDEGAIRDVFATADDMGRLAVMVYNSGITGPNSALAEVTTEIGRAHV